MSACLSVKDATPPPIVPVGRKLQFRMEEDGRHLPLMRALRGQSFLVGYFVRYTM